MNWKNRMKGIPAMEKEETTAELESQRDKLVMQLGVHTFQIEINTAQKLKVAQQILNINEKLQKRQQEAVGAPKIVPVDVVLPPEAQPAPEMVAVAGV